MSRPEWTHVQKQNDTPPVPEIQGKAKTGKTVARPIVEGTKSPSQKVWHSAPHSGKEHTSSAYAIFDNELAGDNLENDITAADMQDM